MVLFELMDQDPQIAQWEAIDRALALFYIDQPTDLDQAVEGMLWFYRCGQDPPRQTEHIGGSRGAQAYSFEQDAAYIYSAFWAQYHLDLQQERMHWWKFRALFSGLYEQVPLTKIMGYRTADTKGMDRGTKAFYNRMKRQYAIETKEMRQQKQLPGVQGGYAAVRGQALCRKRHVRAADSTPHWGRAVFAGGRSEDCGWPESRDLSICSGPGAKWRFGGSKRTTMQKAGLVYG